MEPEPGDSTASDKDPRLNVDPDAMLVARARRADTGAFEQLYRRHAGRVNALCVRLCGDRHHGEDLCQESFVQAWRKLGDFRGEAAFGTWLYRIAANIALGHLRRQKSWPVHEDLEDVEAMLPAQRGPASEAIDLERAIATLPPRARAVLVLHDIEGLDHAEIGTALGIAVGTSKAQLHRARQALIGRLA
jgi:RNA polymerase sigma factor (sigma-70 family)